ncbi:MAG: RNA polymerase sigma factor [Beutenbergiaceae bacterium]
MTHDDDPVPVTGSVRPVLASIDREGRARLLATLIRRFRDIDVAEDALQEALGRALTRWPEEGIPQSPQAWLLTVAKRAAIDDLRRGQTRDRGTYVLGTELMRGPTPTSLRDPAEQVLDAERDPIPDDRLGLLFACAHPALKVEDRIALTLRFVVGLTTTEIAYALLMPRPTLQQRITRAKARIRKLGISFEPPSRSAMAERVADVRRIIYLLYAEGFARSTGKHHVRDDLTAEALRLARLLQAQHPDSAPCQSTSRPSAESTGLLALLQLTEARRPARMGADGRPIPLADQDRGKWDAEMISSGIALAEQVAAMPDAGSYAIQAAIAAVHAEAEDFEHTDWQQIAVLYRLLETHEPGPVVKLGRAIAVGRAYGPEIGLRRLDELAGETKLAHSRALHIARALTLEELGEKSGAADAYRRALKIPGNEAEELLLTSSLAELQSGEFASG